MVNLPAFLLSLLPLVGGVVVALSAESIAAAVFYMILAALLALLLYDGAHRPTLAATRIDKARAPTADSLFDTVGFATLSNQEKSPQLAIRDMTVVFANRAAKQLLGAHIVGSDVRSAIRHPSALDLLIRPALSPTPAPRSDSDSPHHANSTALFDFQTSGDHWLMKIATLGDIGRLVTLEDRSQINAIERMRSDFVANASHELRTPLTIITSYIEALQDSEDSEATDDNETNETNDNSEARARFLATIAREASHMEQLIADLMSISRLELDRHRPPSEAVSLPAIVQTALATFGDEANPRIQDIVTDIAAPADEDADDTAAALIAGDASQLTQLVKNIIDNALKYGEPHTAVEVKIARTAQRIVFSVRDYGAGIATEHIPRLTERFYRIEETTNRARKGTGLGLAIVKNIAERHRAHLTIESQIGKGTCVSVAFPILSASPTH